MSGRRVNRFDELARDVPPARDLWPGIAAAIAADARGVAMVSATGPGGGAWRRPAYATAAAIGLVAIGVFLGMQFGSTSVVMPVAGTQGGTGDVIPASLQRDAAYRKQRSELLAEVQVRLNAMPETERAKIKGSLDTLQRSISEIEAALGRDPANALLQELLVSSCQEEMRVLTTVRDSGSQEI
jgi:hypothetical protein